MVIGVGDYPHLIDGTGVLTDSNDSMRQLSSPPVSAKAFANWLIREFHNPDRPLGTVQLLISEDTPSKFEHPDQDEALTIGRANFKNIEKAVNHWKEQADKHLDGMTIFYFCGHGLSEGMSMVLLPSDFGSEDNAYKHSIDFLNIYNSMDQRKATKQCYYVDACRASSDSLNGNKGRSLLQSRPREVEGTRIAPVYYSTLKSKLSHAAPDSPSWFTTALLNCLSHFGADTREGDWRVTNFGLADALDHIMDGFIQNGIPKVQTPDSTEIRDRFAINYLSQSPHALLYLDGNPLEDFVASKLRCTDVTGNAMVRDPIVLDDDDGPSEWVVRVTSGKTKIQAFKADQDVNIVPPIASDEIDVRPPYQRHRLDYNA